MRNPKELFAEAAIFTAATVGLAACSSDGNEGMRPNDGSVTTIELTPEQRQEVGKICVNGFNMDTDINAEFAQSELGGPNSLMGSFTEVNENGENVPVTTEIFGDKLLDEVCVKPEVLATITAYMTEPAGLFNGKAVAPNASTLARVNELATMYRKNDQAALDAIKVIASVVKADKGTELVNDFSVIENQSRYIVPKLENGKVTGLEAKSFTVGDLYTGFVFNYNKEGLTDKQRADREAVRMLVLIGKDGEFIVKVWIGDDQVSITPDTTAPETTTVNTQEDQNNGQDSDNSSETEDTANGGGNGGSNGSNGGETSSDTTDGKGGGNTGVDTTTSGTGTSAPGTTTPEGSTTTKPVTTTTRPVTTTTQPVPTTTQPATTTTQPKGTASSTTLPGNF